MAGTEWTPPHDPRTETPRYRAAHQFLIHEKKAPCEICGVTIDTVAAPDTLETHHWPIERSLVDACDAKKVHADFPVVFDRTSLLLFVDSPANLKVLCSTHHRSPTAGIHHLVTQDWVIQRYLRDGYTLVSPPTATAAERLATQTQDDAIERAAGEET